MRFPSGRRGRAVLFALGLALVALVTSAAGQASGPPSLAWFVSGTQASAYDYGTVAIGAKPSQTFTLKNSGGSATSALTIALTGSSAFTKTSDSCMATSLGPNKTCTVIVRYAPSTGNGDSATLTATGKKPAATASITLTGSGAVDWPMFHNTLSRDGWNSSEHVLSPTTVSGLTQKWTTTTGGSVESSPAVASGVVYVGSDDGGLYAVDAATGAIEWKTSTGGAISSSPAVANGTVYVGSDDGRLYTVDAATGAIEWERITGGAIDSTPAIVNGTVYVGSADGRLYALDPVTGAAKWERITSGQIESSPAVANGLVYFVSDEGKLYALDATTGAATWITSIAGLFYCTPAVANGVVYLGSPADGTLYALDAVTGVIKWTKTTNGAVFSSPAVANGVVYVGSDDASVYAFGLAG
jgi:outer membrane protein assembly factor BamB